MANRYKLLAGKHAQKGPDGRTRVYEKGDVFESNHNLVRLFNRPGATKFQDLDEELAAPPAPPPLAEGHALGGTPHQPAPVRAQDPRSAAEQAKATPAPAPAHAPLPIGIKEMPKAESLEAMSIKDLQDLAAAEEVNLKGSKDKTEIIKILRQAGHK